MKTQTTVARPICPKTKAGGFTTACAARLLRLFLLLTLPAAAQAQFTYTTAGGTITITGYIGSGGAVAIPGVINGLPVIGIGHQAFFNCTSLTSVTIPNNVTTIGNSAFALCFGLTNVTIGNSVVSLGTEAFSGCTSLAGVTIPNSVTSFGKQAFDDCRSLAGVTIPNSVTNIGEQAFEFCGLRSVTLPNSLTSIGSYAFYNCGSLASVRLGNSLASIGDSAFSLCPSLVGVCFQGDAPTLGLAVFDGDDKATVYYLPGALGWGPAFGGRPGVLWNPQVQTQGSSFGTRTNQFGFSISGASNLVVVVEASTSLAEPTWCPLQTNTLTGSLSYFSDLQWTNYSGRFYRLRWP